MFNRLLARARHRPAVSVETWRRDAFAEARLCELHAFSDRLMAETFEHFRQHALTNDVVHVFRRRDTGDVIGFQFWRTADISLPRSRVILGGKLRVDPAFRNRGLHLLSGLAFFLQQKLRHPFTRYYRLSIASVFGFVSIAGALRDYRFVNMRSRDREEQAVAESFRSLAKQNEFRLDEHSGLMFVNIFMTAGTLQAYPSAWFERPAARVYAAVNPGFRTNGCFANFWFRFTPRNLCALVRQIALKLG